MMLCRTGIIQLRVHCSITEKIIQYVYEQANKAVFENAETQKW